MKTALILALSFVLMACSQVSDDSMTDESMSTETMMPAEAPAVEVETPAMEGAMENEAMMKEEGAMENEAMMKEEGAMENEAMMKDTAQ